MRDITSWAGRVLFLVALCIFSAPEIVLALGETQYVVFNSSPGAFPIVAGDQAAQIYVDANDWPGVIRAAKDLSNDITAITDKTPELLSDSSKLGKHAIIIGTVGKNGMIDQLASAGKIDVSTITSKWEASFTQVISNPLPGVESALVIAGSDKRGTIYAIYDISEQSGQSPWYYWADVPAKKHAELFVKAGKVEVGEPSVKYRGIFFNDEAPSLSNYVREKYGNVAPNSDPAKGPPMPDNVANYGREFYTRVFELLLRCKGNYMWPAMWNNAFNEDDPENARLADEYGIVMGTSHQEAMLRAQKEWDRRFPGRQNNWNYATNPQRLEEFWREGLTRNKDFESILTMGLRGQNDTAMVRGTDEAIALLNKIIPAQRAIIAETINPDVTKVPQMWCLYKEVQNYYETGKLDTPPDDITLLWAEDNNGNIRRVPTAEERKRSGGAGIYYHFDYHGGPTDYRWINTSPVARIYDQMSIAKQYGADRIWIVNVGKFKNIEVAIDYFLNLGWNTNRWTHDNTMEYHRLWATREFGAEHANEIAEIVAKYTKYNGRRKPERLVPATYSAVNYREAETVAAEYNALFAKAEALGKKLPADQQDAYYQLVLFPVQACANLNEMYMAGGLNALYAKQGRVSANDYAEMAKANFEKDAALMAYFNNDFAGGRWKHFQSDVHIGYTSWQQPRQPSMVRIPLVTVTPTEAPTMGVAIEGSESAWPGGSEEPALPSFNSIAQEKRAIDVFNKGTGAVDFTAVASEPWIVVSDANGSVAKDHRLWVSIDWSKVPKDAASGNVKISHGEQSVTVKVDAITAPDVTRETLAGFVESGGVVSIEPEHFTAKTEIANHRWVRVEDYGRTLSAMRVDGPVDFPEIAPEAGKSPSLEYKAYFFTSGKVTVRTALAPNLAFIPGRDLKYAVSFDDQPPVIVNAIPKTHSASGREWETNCMDEARYASAELTLPSAGYHTLKIWMVDPGITIQKITIDAGGLKPSYLGPPESFRGSAQISMN